MLAASLEIAQHRRQPCRARDRRDLTVPTGMSSALAISSCDRSCSSRSTKAARYGAASSPIAFSSARASTRRAAPPSSGTAGSATSTGSRYSTGRRRSSEMASRDAMVRIQVDRRAGPLRSKVGRARNTRRNVYPAPDPDGRWAALATRPSARMRG
jgi:hypothetical protein